MGIAEVATVVVAIRVVGIAVVGTAVVGTAVVGMKGVLQPVPVQALGRAHVSGPVQVPPFEQVRARVTFKVNATQSYRIQGRGKGAH